jgi:pilus assembly protein CpaF
MGPDGQLRGYFHATGVRPKFVERLQSFGITLPDNMFDPDKHYE